MKYQEIETELELIELLQNFPLISNYAFQNVDFLKHESFLIGKKFEDCIFLGCQLPNSIGGILPKDNLVFPMIDIPFNPYLGNLYTRETLLGEYIEGKPESYENTLDKRIYNHFLKEGKIAIDIKETLSRRLHDHAITDALYDFIENYDEKKIVAIMGGHGLSRSDKDFVEIALISKRLTESGYLMISGGGPGAMEATHVGAWFAGKDDSLMLKAIDKLAEAPIYNDFLWQDKAFQVIRENPDPIYESIGIPTWLYGHEPPTPFATKIAKYFANSVREDGLLTIAKGGVIFAPGSAGTIQEIFQEATQNHYLSCDYASPMVFYNTNYWSKEYPIYPLLESLSKEGKYRNLILSKYDNQNDIVNEIFKFTNSFNNAL
ncbi:MAG: LOG family protein [Mangrovibacterium sp.]